MEKMDKIAAINYLTTNNPICEDCARGSLRQIRIAAGLYQMIKDIVINDKEYFVQEDLDSKIIQVTGY